MNIKIKQIDLIKYAKEKYQYNCNEKGDGHCPLPSHPGTDKNSSFSIYVNKNKTWAFKCHTEGLSGSIIDLVQAMENVTTGEAISRLETGLSQSPKNRRIEREHIYYDATGKPIRKKIKYRNDSQGESWLWMHLEKSGGWETGKGDYEEIPYNLYGLTQSKNEEVIICEGEKDSDTVTSLGPKILSTCAPNGKDSWPDDITKHFSKFKKITFLYDVGNDESARKHAQKLGNKFPKTKIYIGHVPMKNREEDITNYLEQFKDKKTKREKLRAILKNADIFVAEKAPVTQGDLKPDFILLSEVEPQPVNWLWPNRFPLGKLSLIVGDPGQGKSILSLFMTATVTKGYNWPEGTPCPRGSVIILTTEDDINDTIRPRAEAAGADLTKICILNGVTKGDESTSEPFDLNRHLSQLEEIIKNNKDCRLVIIDPVSTYLGGTDSHKDAEVRKTLAPYSRLAAKYNLAIVAIIHMNKDVTKKALYRTMGSLAFMAIARAVWVILNDKDPERRLLIPEKANLSRFPDGLAFRIKDGPIIAGQPRPVLIFEKDPIKQRADNLISEEREGDFTRVAEAQRWLEEQLQEGDIFATEIMKDGINYGFPRPTLLRAKKKAGIKSIKSSHSLDSKWKWSLAA